MRYPVTKKEKNNIPYLAIPIEHKISKQQLMLFVQTYLYKLLEDSPVENIDKLKLALLKHKINQRKLWVDLRHALELGGKQILLEEINYSLDLSLVEAIKIKATQFVTEHYPDLQ